MTLVGKRHSLLDYLAKNDREQYLKLLDQLGLRK
jgi:ribosomal protein S15P/S13E